MRRLQQRSSKSLADSCLEMASTDSDFVTAVNFMLEDCRSVHRIDSLEEFSSAAVIVELCEKILGQTLQGRHERTFKINDGRTS